MHDFRPPRPTGNTREANFMQRQHDAAYAPENQLVTGPLARIQRTARGLVVIPQTPRRAPARKHPFQIYSCADDTPTADDWRKFRIHHGECFLNWSQVTVTGTDNDASPVSILADDATAKFWFWLEVSGGAVSIGSGADPQTFSAGKVPIGYVDTTTSGTAVITLQMLTTNAYLCV